MDPQARVAFRERLWPSWWLWFVTFVLAGTLGIAVGVATSAAVGWIVALVGIGVCWWALWRGSWLLVVDDDGLRVGPVRLPAENLGPATGLDAAAARRKRGVEADARAFTVLRPWVTTAAQVEVVDDIDPTPYWLVATRHPGELAAAVGQVVTTRRRS